MTIDKNSRKSRKEKFRAKFSKSAENQANKNVEDDGKDKEAASTTTQSPSTFLARKNRNK
eukprot:CAMPEP_0176008382 /NCGR_PEP_ID=MMETSP0120_2-20121206/3717_1 /TAXON_ID=160619 /ORGANISM="Kryptoperidinium foliaceum, Strain CCMP 1326" /LENGTH=59 /DNA_ID=CAMNT_0017341167 /DNA_START=117 /DNA_END=293 /DNA_ORIENTATION=+